MTDIGAEQQESEDKALVGRITKRLLPFLFLLYVVAYLDRVNVSFAKLRMNELHWFSDPVYGLGAGIFFLGYFIFEVPSNLLLQRFGAKRWIARIMFTWGAIAMAMMFVNNAITFYAARFLLGIAEAGFFPGVILYLTYWFTAKERAGLVAAFMLANPVCYGLGGPISGYIMGFKGAHLSGWQWLFLLEGLPAILLGFFVLLYLPDGPLHAHWLSDHDRLRITERLAAEERESPHKRHESLAPALKSPVVWLFCALYLTLVTGMYGMSLWVPQIIKNFKHVNDIQVGFLTAIPYVLSGFAMVINGTHSDRTQERRWHIAIPAVIGGLGLVVLSQTMEHTPWAALIAISFVTSGLFATLGPFWSLPSTRLRGAAAAGGIAIVNSIGNIGGFFGGNIVGNLVKSRGYPAAMIFLAASVFIAVVLALLVPKNRVKQSSGTVGVDAPVAT